MCSTKVKNKIFKNKYKYDYCQRAKLLVITFV